jgi:hypothetical protein
MLNGSCQSGTNDSSCENMLFYCFVSLGSRWSKIFATSRIKFDEFDTGLPNFGYATFDQKIWNGNNYITTTSNSGGVISTDLSITAGGPWHQPITLLHAPIMATCWQTSAHLTSPHGIHWSRFWVVYHEFKWWHSFSCTGEILAGMFWLPVVPVHGPYQNLPASRRVAETIPFKTANILSYLEKLFPCLCSLTFSHFKMVARLERDFSILSPDLAKIPSIRTTHGLTWLLIKIV